jgi:hypothetical protein
LQKDFCFLLTQITGLMAAIPCPMRGAFRDRHGRWARDAVDADALLTNSADVDGEVVWFRRPGAGVKLAKSFAGDGDNKPVTEESTKETVKTIACGNAG